MPLPINHRQTTDQIRKNNPTVIDADAMESSKRRGQLIPTGLLTIAARVIKIQGIISRNTVTPINIETILKGSERSLWENVNMRFKTLLNILPVEIKYSPAVSESHNV